MRGRMSRGRDGRETPGAGYIDPSSITMLSTPRSLQRELSGTAPPALPSRRPSMMMGAEGAGDGGGGGATATSRGSTFAAGRGASAPRTTLMGSTVDTRATFLAPVGHAASV